eukprot:GHVQ01041800.1.p1 GENE.GHVQ01041800.1~~GHVQ01041800.1.p1  ORF type:complete len:411 (-),score=58.87 GHVQ01041800.1:111-1244(-)
MNFGNRQRRGGIGCTFVRVGITTIGIIAFSCLYFVVAMHNGETDQQVSVPNKSLIQTSTDGFLAPAGVAPVASIHTADCREAAGGPAADGSSTDNSSVADVQLMAGRLTDGQSVNPPVTFEDALRNLQTIAKGIGEGTLPPSCGVALASLANVSADIGQGKHHQPTIEQAFVDIDRAMGDIRRDCDLACPTSVDSTTTDCQFDNSALTGVTGLHKTAGPLTQTVDCPDKATLGSSADRLSTSDTTMNELSAGIQQMSSSDAPTGMMQALCSTNIESPVCAIDWLVAPQVDSPTDCQTNNSALTGVAGALHKKADLCITTADCTDEIAAARLQVTKSANRAHALLLKLPHNQYPGQTEVSELLEKLSSNSAPPSYDDR